MNRGRLHPRVTDEGVDESLHAPNVGIRAAAIENLALSDHVVGDDERSGTTERERALKVLQQIHLVRVQEHQIERGGLTGLEFGEDVQGLPNADLDLAALSREPDVLLRYPHMSVYENMAFGLKLRKVPKAEIHARVQEAAAMLGLESLLDRKPKALSGGQRQRVAVGRAIVRKPKVFLFDEPLSNLDAKMRVSMRTEIARLHAHIGATMIYVTHDQVEAMTMGDRICIMKDGEIQQVAEPLSLYNQPANLYAAGFIGSPPMNFFRGTLRKDGGVVRFVEANAKGAPVSIHLPQRLAAAGRNHLDKAVVLGIRPEDLHEESSPREGATATVTVDVSEPMGAETYLYLTSGATSFIARVKPTAIHASGTSVHLAFTPANLHLFDASSEEILS